MGNAAQRWREHISAWRASGTTAKEYCAKQELSVQGLHNWTWRLGLAKARTSRVVEKRKVPKVRLVRVVSTKVKARSPSSGVRIDAGWIQVDVQEDFSRDVLRVVLDVVKTAGATR